MRLRTRASVLLLVGGISVGAFSFTFTHLAGSAGGPGFDDATGVNARFYEAAGVASDASGNVYVADTGNHTIRRISPLHEVTTMAGLAEQAGSLDARGGHARFNKPSGIAVDAAGYLYVADKGNHTIRMIAPDRVVSTIAGSSGESGLVDGTSGAKFHSPSAITLDASGNLYVADTGNHSIRMIASGVVSTLAGTGAAGNLNGTGTAASFESPTGIAWDATTNSLFVADNGNAVIRQITLPDAVVTTFAGTMDTPGHQDGVPGKLFSPFGLVTAGGGALYVSDAGHHSIRYVTAGGSLSSVAGYPTYPGPDDGSGYGARFQTPKGLALSGTTLFVADSGNHTVRAIDTTGGNVVSTPAGLANTAGFVNASGASARFNGPSAVFHYPGPTGSGYSYVADTNNHAIRRVSWDGVVTTLAGGTWGYLEGTGTAARFASPAGLAGTWDGSAYVADTNNHCIRLVTYTGATSLIAGQPQSSGNVDGDRLTTAKFFLPRTIAYTSYPTQALYVHDSGNSAIRKIDLSTGVVSTVMGAWANDETTNSVGLSVSGSDLYIAAGGLVVKRSESGTVTTIAGGWGAGPVDGIGTAARFAYPGPRSVSIFGTAAYVLDSYANQVRKLDLDTSEVTTIGGGVTTPSFPYFSDLLHHPNAGTAGGTGRLARFNNPTAVGGSWMELPVLEGHTLRLGRQELADRATIDSWTGTVGEARQLDATPINANTWSWALIRRPTGSTATLSSTSVRNPTFTPDIADIYVFRCVARNTTTGATSISTVMLTAIRAVTHSWTGALSGAWSSSGNWSPATAPVGGEEHLLFSDPATTKVVNNDLGSLAIANLSIAGTDYTFNGNPLIVSDTVHVRGFGQHNFNQPLSGPASLTKTGDSFAAFNAITLTGPIEVAAGGMAIQGASSVGDISIRSGANLQLLCIQAGTLRISGEAWPYPCESTFTGLIVEPDGSLRINPDPSPGAHIRVNGNVNLAGWLILNIWGAAPTETCTLIENDGADAVIGTFSGQPEGSTLIHDSKPFRLSYLGGDGNDVTVTPLPYITSLAPSSGPTAGGQTVEISGGKLSGASSVTFGGAAGTITAASDTTVTVTTPAHSAGMVDIVIATPLGTATRPGSYTYLPAPAITSVVPASGPTAGGQSVTINGSNLGGGSVSIGGASATVTSTSATAITFTTPAHEAGTVDVVVTTTGGSTTAVNAYTFMPPFGTPPAMEAHAVSALQVVISWIPVTGATSYEIHRSSHGSAFTLRTTTSATTFNDTGLAAATTYLYKVRALGSGDPSAFTPIDNATTIVFTDDPFPSGTTVKSVHVTQLRTAVNAMRAAAGLAAATFSDSAATGTAIRALHVTQLRDALSAARSTITLPPITWTDGTLTTGSTHLKGVHVQQIRDGVK